MTTLSPPEFNVTVNDPDKCTSPMITSLPLPVQAVNCTSPSANDDEEEDRFSDIWTNDMKEAFAEETEEPMDPQKSEFVVNMIMQCITSLPRLIHLESFHKTKSPTIEAFQKSDLV